METFAGQGSAVGGDLMNSKRNAWVLVLAPLLTIVTDQDSPDSGAERLHGGRV
jgi:hypothetical protein